MEIRGNREIQLGGTVSKKGNDGKQVGTILKYYYEGFTGNKTE